MSEKKSAKIFIGFLINPELRIHLNNSQKWKEASMVKTAEDLSEIHHNKKDYIGYLLEEDSPPLEFLEKQKELLLEKLHSYCIDLDTSSLKTILFPQLFLH